MAATFGGSQVASTQVTITNLGTIPGGTQSTAGGLSKNGSVVVGFSNFANNGTKHAFRWTSQTGVIDLGTAPQDLQSFGYSVNANGSVVVGKSGVQAMRWSATEGMIHLSNAISQSLDVNANGSVVVGDEADWAFRWTAEAGLHSLGVLPGGAFSDAYAVSADGNSVVGGSDSALGYHAYLWTAPNGMTDLGVLTGSDTSLATAISGDGKTVVGYSRSSSGDRAFRWTQGGGMEPFQGEDQLGSSAWSVSYDGSIITISGGSGLWIWTVRDGMIPLKTYLVSFGLDLSLWTIGDAIVSSDGTALTGTAFIEGIGYRAYLVRGLPGNLTKRLAPNNQQVTLGRVTKGNLQSLLEDDSNAEEICKFVVPNRSSPFVNVQFIFSSEALVPSEVSLEVKAKWLNPGQYLLQLEQFNFVTGQDEVCLGEAPLTGDYYTFVGSPKGVPTSYVRQSDGQMKGRLKLRQSGPSAVLLPCVSLEYVAQNVKES
ncbi:MAG: hypothetical protein JSS66_03000 [Armatimonadetes bacterium]|nr:hypothetical protein [Armatimonadota bacterium]